MLARRALLLLGIAGLCLAATASPAGAFAATPQSADSANWSGYVAGGDADGGSDQFSSVSGSWVEPSVDCGSNQDNASFWVGLGGAGQQSGALEQVGTGTDCSASGSDDHFAWYELVPAAPVRLDLQVSPGDRLAGRVSVSGTNVTVSLVNQTSGASVTKSLQMDTPDVSSAEWIAEAPSSCDSSGCQPVPLANFGTVNFSNATATANGHTGTISDSSWSTQPVTLSGSSGSTDIGTAGSGGGAEPSGLSADGSSFSVDYATDIGSADGSAGGAVAGSDGGDPGDPGIVIPNVAVGPGTVDGGGSGYLP